MKISVQILCPEILLLRLVVSTTSTSCQSMVSPVSLLFEKNNQWFDNIIRIAVEVHYSLANVTMIFFLNFNISLLYSIYGEWYQKSVSCWKLLWINVVTDSISEKSENKSCFEFKIPSIIFITPNSQTHTWLRNMKVGKVIDAISRSNEDSIYAEAWVLIVFSVFQVWMYTVCLLLLLLSSKAQGRKDFWNPSEPCHVGIHWKALPKYSQMSTRMPGFQSFFRIFASFCIVNNLPTA